MMMEFIVYLSFVFKYILLFSYNMCFIFSLMQKLCSLTRKKNNNNNNIIKNAVVKTPLYIEPN